MNTTLLLVYERDEKQCWLCLSAVSEEDASVDHVLPRSLGGTRARQNLRLAHKRCNSMRGNGFPGTWQEKKPKPPPPPVGKERLKPYQIAAAARRERIKKLMEQMNAGANPR